MYDNKIITFIKVAEKGSFTKASTELFISVPAVKKHIDYLENKWGIILFNRTFDGVKLTEKGELLYKGCVEMVHKSENFLSEIPKDITFTIKIIYVNEWDKEYLLNIIEPFLKENKQYKIQWKAMKIDTYFKSISSFISEDFDYLFFSLDSSLTESRYQFIPLRKDSISFLVPREHKLANKNYLKFVDIEGCTVLLPPFGHFPVLDEIHYLSNKYVTCMSVDYFMMEKENKEYLRIVDNNFQSNDTFKVIPLFPERKMTSGLYCLKETPRKKEIFKEYLMSISRMLMK